MCPVSPQPAPKPTLEASSSLGPQKHLYHIPCDDSLFAQGKKSVSFALDTGQMHVDEFFLRLSQTFRQEKKQKRSFTYPCNLTDLFSPTYPTLVLVRELQPGGAQALTELGQRREGPRAQRTDSRACFSFPASDLGVPPGIYSSPHASCWPELPGCCLSSLWMGQPAGD